MHLAGYVSEVLGQNYLIEIIIVFEGDLFEKKINHIDKKVVCRL